MQRIGVAAGFARLSDQLVARLPSMVARDGERTKESILAAAEDLFAGQGFERTSMQQIGEAADLARSTPAYFFQSKDALYEAVLARVVARAEKALASAHDPGPDRSQEEAVTSYVNALVDLFGRDQNLVRLIQRESLVEGSRMAEFLSRLADDAVTVFGPIAQQAGVSPQRLVLDIFALAWYPIAHANTLPSALGMKPRGPAFLEEQKRHLMDLVRTVTRRPRLSPEAAGSRTRSAGARAPTK
jgi:TetR/AcrR family transcriptional regulator